MPRGRQAYPLAPHAVVTLGTDVDWKGYRVLGRDSGNRLKHGIWQLARNSQLGDRGIGAASSDNQIWVASERESLGFFEGQLSACTFGRTGDSRGT
jgi:hypothetical protein